MTQRLKPYRPPHEKIERARRRPSWRQRLVEAERGLTYGFRSDSVFFVHFFLASIIVATGFTLNVAAVEWAVIAIVISTVLSAEMFNQVLKAVVKNTQQTAREAIERALRISTAAVFVSMLGALIALIVIFVPRIVETFGNV